MGVIVRSIFGSDLFAIIRQNELRMVDARVMRVKIKYEDKYLVCNTCTRTGDRDSLRVTNSSHVYSYATDKSTF